VKSNMSDSRRIFRPDPFLELLEDVCARGDPDFRLYRRETVERRLARRILSAGCAGYADYISYLREKPGEYRRLIDSLTIKVSSFFRDPPVFEVIATQALPALLNVKAKNERYLTIWSAGCAHGQEAYSMAILMRELSRQKYAGLTARIIATDIAEDALAKTRRGIYGEEDLAGVKEDFRSKYFHRRGNLYQINEEIKKMVITGRYNLLTGASGGPPEAVFCSYDLIFCRNVVMYFQRQAQEKVLQSLWKMLVNEGYLVLGAAECLPVSLASRSREVYGGTRIYRKLF